MPDLKALTKKRVVYTLPEMEQSTVRANQTYKLVNGQPLLADIYTARDASAGGNLPAVIFINGDGPPEWIKDAKDWGEYVTWAQLVAASGLAAITFNHRSSEDQLSKMAVVSADVQDLIDYVRENADELGIDRDRLAVWACSAGVPYLTAVMVVPPEYVRCMVAYYGMMDLQQFADALLEGRCKPEQDAVLAILREYSLVAQLAEHPAAMPPMLLAQACQDDPVINDTMQRFVDQAIQAGLPVEYLLHPEGQHGFDILNDDETSRQIIKQTLTFLRKHLLTGNPA